MLELCKRFHCLPSALMAEDDYLLWCLEVERNGGGLEEAV